MHQLTDELIEYIRSDLAEKGIIKEDLRDNLVSGSFDFLFEMKIKKGQ